MTDDLWAPLTPPNPAAVAPRKCVHPRQYRQRTDDGSTCLRCGHNITLAASRRGRAVGKRGKNHERESMKRLGLVNVGGLNRERDGGDRLDPFVAQSKSFAPGRFPGWMLDELQKLRAVGLLPHQTPVLVVTESRQGVKRRGLVVVDIDDWVALHGPTAQEGSL